MAANVVNQVAYLRTSREFPSNLDLLSEECNKSYVDIANAVNNRTISIFPTNRPAITGESWFLTTQRQQTLRQIYTFPIAIGLTTFPHGINTAQITTFTRIYGVGTDGNTWQPLPYVSATATTDVEVGVDPTNIIVVRGATYPGTTAYIVLEWLSRI